MVQRYEQTRKLQWYKRGAAYTATGLDKVIIKHPTMHSRCQERMMFLCISLSVKLINTFFIMECKVTTF